MRSVSDFQKPLREGLAEQSPELGLPDWRAYVRVSHSVC